MNRVSDGDRSTSLSFLSCGALQSDEIIGILKGALLVRREWHTVGLHEHGLAEHSGGCPPGARPDRLCARASLVTVVSRDAGDSRPNLCHQTTRTLMKGSQMS